MIYTTHVYLASGRDLILTYVAHLHTFLSTPAWTACTDMVNSKELECEVTTTAMAKAILRLKTLAPFLHRTWSVRFFYFRSTNKGCHVNAMCKMLLFWAKIGKTSAYFLHVDIYLKKSCSGFDLVTVLISKQSFFKHRIWPVCKVNHIYMEWHCRIFT